jgi:hypothetical protein
VVMGVAAWATLRSACAPVLNAGSSGPGWDVGSSGAVWDVGSSGAVLNGTPSGRERGTSRDGGY